MKGKGMLLLTIVVTVLTTNTLFQLSAAKFYCDSISSKYFQWLNADGSLTISTTYDNPIPAEAYDCVEQWQSIPQSPSCRLCATTFTLVCNDLWPYTLPNPASLPITTLSQYIISGTGLSSLPPKTFMGLSIRKLIIKDTNLTYIGHELFFGVRSIAFLYMEKNSFKELNHVGILLGHLPNLKSLTIDYNRLQTLLSYKSANLQKLEYLSLKGSSFFTLDMFFLQNSTLKFLDLRYSTFLMTVKDIKESGFSLLPNTLSTLDLSNAKIPAGVIKEMFKQLQKNNISMLNAGYLKSSHCLLVALTFLRHTLSFLSLEGTDMSNAFFTDNHCNCKNLKPFIQLRELNLKNCKIDKLKSDDFRIFPNLKVLSLAENRFIDFEISIFIGLPLLNYLNLNGNNILEITNYSNATSQSLKVIDLSSVNFLNLNYSSSANIVNTFPNLKQLSLCNAKVNTTLIESIQKLQQLHYLDLSCILPNSYILLSAFNDLFYALNASLTELYFSSNDLKSTTYNVINFSSLKSLKTLDLSNNLIRDLSQNILGLSIETLNLSQNLITTWYSPIVESKSHIKYLDLSNNQVTYVSEAMVHDFYKLEWLDLTKNPLMCHKKVVAMVCADVKNVTHNLTMASWQNYKCYDIAINNYRLFSEPKECDEYYEEVSTSQQNMEGSITTQLSYQSSSPSAQPIISQRNHFGYKFIGFIILATMAAVISCIIYFKWWEIKCYVHRYFTLRKARLLKKEGLLTKPEIHYDVFVSYSDVDRSWILDSLIPNLETDGDISLCFHERDFQVGLSILENIIECMDRSHSILLVVSSAFVHSKWCQFEMHLAQYRLIETLRNQLVVVLLEDIPRKSRPQVLHHLMITKTYLVWPTQPNKEEAIELFWKRLKRALKPNYSYIFGV